MALNMADLFEHAVDAFPQRVSLICGDRQVTYAGLDEEANRLAHHLAGQGIRPGDHVGLYARNSIAVVTTMLAVIKLRAVSININYRYLAGELGYHLRDADVKALVHDLDLAPLVDAALADPALSDVAMPRVVIGGDYDEKVAAQPGERDFGPRSADDVYMIYTGGTTGQPKGVMWRHEDIWRTLAGGVDFLTGEMLPDEWAQSRKGAEGNGMVRMAPAPLIHGAAMVATLGALFAGDACVILPRFEAHAVWAAVQRHRVNTLSIIGDAMARPLLEALAAGSAEGPYDTSSLFSVNSTAALLSPSVKEALVAALPNAFFTEAVGATETGFTGMAFGGADGEYRGGPTVKAGMDVLVISETGEACGPGEVGRLARGGNIPIGYYKDPAKTAEMFQEVDGKRYAVAGDLARVEEDGSITMLGRGNTCVNTGGMKVYPEEVEGVLKSHPDVFDALVLGVPDERLGQRVAALVQLRPGATADVAALQAHVHGLVAGYKTPRSVWIVESVGRTVSGKADYGWAQRYAAEHPLVETGSPQPGRREAQGPAVLAGSPGEGGDRGVSPPVPGGQQGGRPPGEA